MAYEDIYTIMGIVGGLYAAGQVAYTLWKKLTKKVEIVYSTGVMYQVMGQTVELSNVPPQSGYVSLVGKNEDYQGKAAVPKNIRTRMEHQAKTKNRLINVMGKLHIGIINNKDENACITDILGTFQYDRRKHAQAQLSKYGKPTCFTLRPVSKKPSLPINLEPHEAIDIECTFDLKEVNLSSLERNLPLANLPTYFQDDVPIVIFNPEKIEEHWFSNPVAVQLSVHINGRDLIHHGASLAYKLADAKQQKKGLEIDDKIEDEGNYGTIDHIKNMEIERKFCK